MKKLKVYYAHSVAIYNTPQEERDIATLKALGFEIVNPNSPKIEAQYSGMLGKVPYEVMFDEVFGNAVRACDLVAFRAIPSSNRIGSGVALEITYAEEAELPIIELPGCLNSRRMTVEETKEHLRECGHR